MIKEVVKKIRKEYKEDVPIIVRIDSGFFDGDNFKKFDELGIEFICSGNLYEDIKEYIINCSEGYFKTYKGKQNEWQYFEFDDQRKCWDTEYRAIFCRGIYEGKQMLFEFSRPDMIIYTNIGIGMHIDELLNKTDKQQIMQANMIISLYHDRGADELVNRALKDFGTEHLPFKRFEANSAFFYTMLVAFFLFESFKEDVIAPIAKVSSYATTIRRKVIDIAAKIVHNSRKIILKVPKDVAERLNIFQLWCRCNNVAVILRI